MGGREVKKLGGECTRASVSQSYSLPKLCSDWRMGRKYTLGTGTEEPGSKKEREKKGSRCLPTLHRQIYLPR